MTASSTPQPSRHASMIKPSLEELATAKGLARSVTLADLPHEQTFDNDDELDAFLAFVTEQRHEQLA